MGSEMTREDIIKMAREAGATPYTNRHYPDRPTHTFNVEQLERLVALVAAAEREKVAAWMIQRSYATGHGDTTEDLLVELEWQVRESEREACAKVCESRMTGANELMDAVREMCADAIRARGQE